MDVDQVSNLNLTNNCKYTGMCLWSCSLHTCINIFWCTSRLKSLVRFVQLKCNCNESIFTDSCTYQTFFIIRNAKTNKIFVKINFIFHVEKLTNTTICSTSFKFIFIKCDKLLFMITVYLLVWGTFIKQNFFSNNVMVCNILYCIHQKIKKIRTRIKFGWKYW